MEMTDNGKKKKEFKYIIMCGGRYEVWETPRHLSKICGEEIVARTIRLLRENGIEDISISSDDNIFEKFGLPVLKHKNSYVSHNFGDVEGDWFDAFYPTDEPTCYLFGDVVFSPEAIKTIIETETEDMEFFGSKPPFGENYFKNHEEPFALKVVNTDHLKEAIKKTKKLDKEGKFWRKPLMWELWTVIKDVPLQTKPGEYTADYIAINDYTVDVDRKSDIDKLQFIVDEVKVKVITLCNFTLANFNLIRNSIVRADKYRNEEGHLYTGDTFECSSTMANYLTGDNKHNKKVVDIIEVIPNKKDQ